MRLCTNCVLPSTFPGINLNEEGVCNYCLDLKGAEYRQEKKAEYRKKFEAALKQHKGKSNYDVLMCYSGGKDSTLTLAILKEKYSLNIAAITYDNGFLPNQTLGNIRTVVEKLSIDHIFFKPSFDTLSKIFRYCAKKDIYPPKALERASSICSSCMGIIKYSALRFALEKNIPFVAFGWSPGQVPITTSIMKNNPQMVKQMQKIIYDPLYQIVGSEIKPYFLEDKHFRDPYRFPQNIHPLVLIEYSEENIFQNISRLGWRAPEDVDANSTNCLLNSFANVVHKQRFGFNPYTYELANLVRAGYMDRATALRRLNQQEDPHIVAMVGEKLGVGKDFFGS